MHQSVIGAAMRGYCRLRRKPTGGIISCNKKLHTGALEGNFLLQETVGLALSLQLLHLCRLRRKPTVPSCTTYPPPPAPPPPSRFPYPTTRLAWLSYAKRCLAVPSYARQSKTLHSQAGRARWEPKPTGAAAAFGGRADMVYEATVGLRLSLQRCNKCRLTPKPTVARSRRA
jgi:hypothetical protein